MLSRERSIENFEKNADALIQSNYIFATVRITTLLKGIATSKLFLELFNFCVDGFDFEEAKKNVIVHDEIRDTYRFVLPRDSKSIIAFVFMLLCEIDSNSAKLGEQKSLRIVGDGMELIDILDKCFHEESYNLSFKRFASEVLIPFKNEVINAAKTMIGETPDFDTTAIVVSKVEEPVLTDEQSEKIKKLLSESKSIILQYKMEPKLKSELLTLYDNFSDSLYGTSRDKLKVAFLGYKYCTLYHRKLDVSVSKIEKILQAAGILDDYENE